jgi:hypothetical protein
MFQTYLIVPFAKRHRLRAYLFLVQISGTARLVLRSAPLNDTQMGLHNGSV